MIKLPAGHPLRRPIKQAWAEVRADPQHRLRVATRLDLYDQLIGDLGVPLREVGPSTYWLPKVTPGLKRYWFLAFATITPLRTVWQREVGRWLAGNPGYEPYQQFPDVMLDAARDLLRGIPYAEVEAQLGRKTDYWTGISAWHHNVGNMCDDLPLTAGLCLYAFYDVYLATLGRAPFTQHVADQACDDRIDLDEHHDVAAHTLAAVASMDDPTITWRTAQASIGAGTALGFWGWWLLKLLPQAAMVDSTALGWPISDFQPRASTKPRPSREGPGPQPDS